MHLWLLDSSNSASNTAEVHEQDSNGWAPAASSIGLRLLLV